jgi:hypothetical protein
MEENVTKLRALVRSDRHLTVRMIGSELNLNHQTIHGILTEELGMQTLGCCMTTVPVDPKPLYLPDLSPCDFFLFPKLKFHLKGRHLGTVDNIRKLVTEQLRALPHEDFQHCYGVYGFRRELL